MTKRDKTVFVCDACGEDAPRWQGQCPSCGAWNTLKQMALAKTKGGTVSLGVAASPLSLADLPSDLSQAVPTGIIGLDDILGQGLVPGSVLLLSGEPGIGKSTLLLQMAASLARAKHKVLYVSGEESAGQIRGRAERLNALHPDLMVLATVQAEDILASLENAMFSLVIVDSIQTMASSQVDGLPGSMSQVRCVGSLLAERAKRTGTAFLFVGHVTKEGQIAGPKLLEHMVDTVLYLEGDREQVFRLLRVVKNRFGRSDELLVLHMREQGLEPVLDPSTFFLESRSADVSGAALVMALDGNRPFAVEVQALVSKSYLAIPRRAALGFDANRLHLLLAVMERRLRVNLGQMDIYAKIGGGLKLQEPGLDLGVVAAVLSSLYDRPLPEGAVFWGEVDLNGRIRPVLGEELRQRQVEKLGYGPLFFAKTRDHAGGYAHLSDLQSRLFGRSKAEDGA